METVWCKALDTDLSKIPIKDALRNPVSINHSPHPLFPYSPLGTEEAYLCRNRLHNLATCFPSNQGGECDSDSFFCSILCVCTTCTWLFAALSFCPIYWAVASDWLLSLSAYLLTLTSATALDMTGYSFLNLSWSLLYLSYCCLLDYVSLSLYTVLGDICQWSSLPTVPVVSMMHRTQGGVQKSFL